MQTNAKTLSDVPAINRFLSYCRVRTVPSKTVMIHAGDLPDVLYYIVDCSVEVMIEDEDGNEMVLAYLNKGDFFGEMGVFEESEDPRSAWVRTKEQCVVAEISYSKFHEFSKTYPEFLYALGAQISRRLRKTTRKVGDLAFLDVTGRVARTLLELSKEPDAMTHPDGTQIKVNKLLDFQDEEMTLAFK